MKYLLITLLTLASLNVTASPAKNGVQQQRALFAYLTVQPGTEHIFLEASKAVITESRKEPGNLIYNLHQSAESPQKFVFYELFKSERDLQIHRRAKHTKDFLKIVDSILVPGQFILDSYDMRDRTAPPVKENTEPLAMLTYIQVKPGMEGAFKEEVAGIMTASRARPGNLAWYVQQSKEDSTQFVFYTQWADKASLQHHLTTLSVDGYIQRTQPMMANPIQLSEYVSLDLRK